MELVQALFGGLFAFTPQMLVMYAIGALLIWLAVKKDYEPMLLLPIGFGAILVNLPFATAWLSDGMGAGTGGAEPGDAAAVAGEAAGEVAGILKILYDSGIATELFPCLIFIAVGAMIDFSELIKNPRMLLFGAAAQFGIFFTVLAALWLGNALDAAFGMNMGIDLKTAASIGIIGAADGPTSIVVASKFARQHLGPITVAAYSYMALVPIIQPPVIRLLTTRKERLIRMSYQDRSVSKAALIAFPVIVTLVSGILAPFSAPLVGLLMFGNLIRVCGVLERLSQAAQNELANIVTLLLGITIGATMRASEFLRPITLLILALGLVAFVFDTAGGVLFAKLLNVFSKNKINPMVGAAGISAFPMSARIVQKMAAKEDPTNFILMQSTGANVAGQLGSVVAGGLILSLVPWLLSL
ncbi:MAG: sodium ion-translocating decarboxylase subunit beta [Clostridiales bacterium]|jgi:oxaloacetate decarboxylase beta subunit|nr:sodium ion-translocating decarboxylase subunit beta [Clostridiales bacterium]